MPEPLGSHFGQSVLGPGYANQSLPEPYLQSEAHRLLVENDDRPVDAPLSVDDSSKNNPLDSQIVQHLLPGSYMAEVSASAAASGEAASGAYQLEAR